ncbi:MAG: Chain length determinant protein, partial [Acidobacteriota bacterium]
MTHPLPTRPTTLADYLAILNRRKWLILLPLILAPAVTVLLSSRQEPLYRASADVYVKRSDVAVAVAGVTNPALQQDPVRYMQTQADVARDPKLAQMVVDAAGIRGLTRGAVLADSSVTPRPDADILTVAATDTNRHTAVRLANTYADQFTKFRTQLDTARIDDALTATTDRMRELRASGASINSPAYVTLVQNEIKLQTIGKLLAKSTEVLRPATGAGKIRPQTRRDAIF